MSLSGQCSDDAHPVDVRSIVHRWMRCRSGSHLWLGSLGVENKVSIAAAPLEVSPSPEWHDGGSSGLCGPPPPCRTGPTQETGRTCRCDTEVTAGSDKLIKG